MAPSSSSEPNTLPESGSSDPGQANPGQANSGQANTAPGSARAAIRYVAIGDSFTEGVGDEVPGPGGVAPRGWADLVAQGLADATGQPIQYANLAIRGRLLAGIISEQLEPAIALEPTLVSFNGGGNDMLRPGIDVAWVRDETERALSRIQRSGAEPLLLAGANPTGGLPSGARVQRKGDALVEAARGVAQRLGTRFCDNWNDRRIAERQYWSNDRLHLSPVGHHRVAANVLRTLGYDHPADWQLDADPIPRPTRLDQLRYTREHVVPWIQRRLTGKSSGDGRSAKYADWIWVHPRGA